MCYFLILDLSGRVPFKPVTAHSNVNRVSVVVGVVVDAFICILTVSPSPFSGALSYSGWYCCETEGHHVVAGQEQRYCVELREVPDRP